LATEKRKKNKLEFLQFEKNESPIAEISPKKENPDVD
jgi:hypothetical protein